MQIEAGHSQIYPELAKMAADGHVTVEAEGPRGRKIYAITAEGTAELHTWLVEHSPAGNVRNESALQAFLLPLLDAPQAVEVLDRLRVRYTVRLEQLENLRPETDTAHPTFGKYALDLGIRQIRTYLKWLDDTIAELQRL